VPADGSKVEITLHEQNGTYWITDVKPAVGTKTVMHSAARWIAWSATVFALHFVWEMVQASWFASMQALPFWTATALCFRAAGGDLALTVVAFAIAGLVARSASWPLRARVAPAGAAFLLVGLAITIGYEMYALETGRWRYDERMPTILGIGLTPLLQWTILPLLEIGLFRMIWRQGSRDNPTTEPMV